MAIRDFFVFPVTAVIVVAINVLESLPATLSEDCQRVDPVLWHCP